MRRLADNTLKDCGEMRLRLKADAERDVDERQARMPKQILSAFNAPPQ